MTAVLETQEQDRALLSMGPCVIAQATAREVGPNLNGQLGHQRESSEVQNQREGSLWEQLLIPPALPEATWKGGQKAGSEVRQTWLKSTVPTWLAHFTSLELPFFLMTRMPIT